MKPLQLSLQAREVIRRCRLGGNEFVADIRYPQWWLFGVLGFIGFRV